MTVRRLILVVLLVTPFLGAQADPSPNSPELVVAPADDPPDPPDDPPDDPPPDEEDCAGISGKKWDYLSNTCKDCVYFVSMFNDGWILDTMYSWDGDLYGNTIGNNPHGGIQTTFAREDVVSRFGTVEDLPVFNMLEAYFRSQLDHCFSPMTGGSSQCVVYDAKNRFGYHGNPLAYQVRQPYMMWFHSVRSMWLEEPYGSGNMVRHDLKTPNYGVLFATGGDSWAAAFDANGNQLDINSLLDPVQDTENYWWHHTLNIRQDSNYISCYRWEVKGVASPVALLMPGCDYKNEEPTIAPFSLDRRKPNASSVWHGSKCMPLLAIDPQKTGKITSAAQLIGDWTNGGKFGPAQRAASMSADGLRSKWKHGFEALGSFDNNNNGTIEKDELATLLAWTDANANGISDEGELKSLTELGVTELRYRGFRPLYNGDLEVKEGYTAVINGQQVKGTLIDWYGVVSEDKETLRAARPVNTKLRSETDTASVCERTDTFEGGWRYWLEGNPKKTTMGFLTLSQTPDRKLVGNSFSIMQVKRANSPAAGMLLTWPLVAEQNGAAQAKFSIPSKHGAVLSDVQLVNDGMELKGKTIATAGNGKAKSYEWRAERINCARKQKPAQS